MLRLLPAYAHSSALYTEKLFEMLCRCNVRGWGVAGLSLHSYNAVYHSQCVCVWLECITEGHLCEHFRSTYGVGCGSVKVTMLELCLRPGGFLSVSERWLHSTLTILNRFHFCQLFMFQKCLEVSFAVYVIHALSCNLAKQTYENGFSLQKPRKIP